MAMRFKPPLAVPAAPRPSSGSVEVPQPLDDRTQNVNGAGEYVGTTPWGTRWNTSVNIWGLSITTTSNPSMSTIRSVLPAVPLMAPRSRRHQFGPNLLRYGLYPDNNANGVTWDTAVNLPIWNSRYVSTLQYTAFRQNDPFINDATNGITTLAPYPASSLNGEVNAFLTNNVLTRTSPRI